MSTQRFRLPLLISAVLAALYLLLIQERIALPNRAAMALWNLAHLPLFFALTLVFDHSVLKRHHRSAPIWLQYLLPPMLILAIGTEWLQSQTGRQPSWQDVLTNCSGIALGCIWIASRRYANGWLSRAGRLLVMLTALALLIRPSLLLYADYHIKQQFPVLSNFESFIDSENWSLGIRHQSPVRDGAYALQVQLPPQRFAGTTLRHFPNDWRTYHSLNLSVFNPGSTALPLSLRIHDRQHELGKQEYHDRFNYNFSAAPGWTDIQLPLERIASGPRERKLDLEQVTAMRVFYQGTPAEGTTVFLDAVSLK